MLEAAWIISIVFACLYMPLRGKTYDVLTPKQQRRVQKNFTMYLRSKKGRKNPDMKIEEYLPILQKQAITYLILAIVIFPVYIFTVINIYS